MDPDETWAQLLDAWTERRWLDVINFADALLEWFALGGFPPKAMEAEKLGREWNEVLTSTLAMFAKDRAKQVLNDPNGVPVTVEFTISCFYCHVDGPDTFYEASQKGWGQIQYLPSPTPMNFTGVCDTCRRRESARTDHGQLDI